MQTRNTYIKFRLNIKDHSFLRGNSQQRKLKTRTKHSWESSSKMGIEQGNRRNTGHSLATTLQDTAPAAIVFAQEYKSPANPLSQRASRHGLSTDKHYFGSDICNDLIPSPMRRLQSKHPPPQILSCPFTQQAQGTWVFQSQFKKAKISSLHCVPVIQEHHHKSGKKIQAKL